MGLTKSLGLSGEYDRKLNLIYFKVNPTVRVGLSKKIDTDDSLITNLAIFDIGKNHLTHFFEKGTANKILWYGYENAFNEKYHAMEFNTEIHRVFNNQNLEKRERADKLFVVRESQDGNTRELWISNRKGEDKRLVKSYPRKTDWWIDVHNQKVIFVFKLKNEVKVEAIDW